MLPRRAGLRSELVRPGRSMVTAWVNREPPPEEAGLVERHEPAGNRRAFQLLDKALTTHPRT